MSLGAIRVVVSEKQTALEDQSADQLMHLFVVSILDILRPLPQNELVKILIPRIVPALLPDHTEILPRLGILSIAVQCDNRILHEVIQSALECGRVIPFIRLLIGHAHRVHQIKIRNEHVIHRRLLSGQENPSGNKGLLQRLGNHPVAVDALPFRTVHDSKGRPVDRERIGEPPVERSIFPVDLQHDFRTELVILPEPAVPQETLQRPACFRFQSRGKAVRQESELPEFTLKRIQIFESGFFQSLPQCGVLRMELPEFRIAFRCGGESLPVRFDSAVRFHHLLADHILVIPLSIVEHISDLVLIDPSELPVEKRIVGIVVQSLVADQLDSALNPAPAVHRRRECDGNIIRHVPCQIRGSSRKLRLKLGDPRRQLNHLKIFSLLLQSVCPQPEHIRQNSAESAKRHRCERHHRRKTLDISLVDQLVLLDDRIQALLHKHRRRQQNHKGRNREKPDPKSSEIHLSHLLVAASESSRRL